MTESDTTDAFRYTCSCCGELHEGSPSFGYKAPDAWLSQPEAVQKKGQIGSDLCFSEDLIGMRVFFALRLSSGRTDVEHKSENQQNIRTNTNPFILSLSKNGSGAKLPFDLAQGERM